MSKKKIDELTKVQVEKMPEYRDKWLKVGLSTEPLDRERSSKAIDEVYKCAGMKPPHIKIFLDSPYAGCFGSAYLKNINLPAQVGDQVRDQVRDQVGAQVRAAGYGSHDANWLGFYNFFHAYPLDTQAHKW